MPGLTIGLGTGLGNGFVVGFVGVLPVGVTEAELLLSSEASEEFSRFQLFLLLSLVFKLGAAILTDESNPT